MGAIRKYNVNVTPKSQATQISCNIILNVIRLHGAQYPLDKPNDSNDNLRIIFVRTVKPHTS